MNLDLKLLGDIQVYDMPYLSLYTDEASHTFYLAFLISCVKGTSADYVVAPIRAERLLEFLHQEITVKDLFLGSERKFLWHKERGKKGFIVSEDIKPLENRIDNLKYNPLLCEDEEVILDYLQGV